MFSVAAAANITDFFSNLNIVIIYQHGKEGNAMKKYSFKIFILSVIIMISGCATKPTVDLTPVKEVDLSRYLGTWYEIARYDHWFERGMSHTKAEYTMRDDGKVAVVNAGIEDGKPKIAKGRVKLTDEPGLLRVSFFGPFYGDYRILWLDNDYKHVLVGGSNADFLGILARTSQIDPATKSSS